MSSALPAPARPDDLAGLRQLLLRALRRWPAAVRDGAAAGVIAVLVLLVWPETYRAHAVVLPPQADNSGSIVAALLAQSGVTGVSLGSSGAMTSDLYMEILQSRSVRGRVIEALDLTQAYGLSDLPADQALASADQRLQSETSVGAALSGAVTIVVNTRTGPLPLFHPADREAARQRASRIANAYCDALNQSNVDRTRESAGLTRTYLQAQIDEARGELESWTKQLLDFQRAHGAIALEEQTRLAMEVSGDIRSNLLAARLELGLLRRTDSESSPRVRALRTRIDELEAQIRDLDGGSSPATPGGARPGATQSLLGPRLSELPEIGQQYAKLYAEVKIREVLTEILTQRMYEARLQESKDLPTIQVLDRATPPLGKAAPRRIMTVLVAGFLGALAGLGGALLLEELAARQRALAA